MFLVCSEVKQKFLFQPPLPSTETQTSYHIFIHKEGSGAPDRSPVTAACGLREFKAASFLFAADIDRHTQRLEIPLAITGKGTAHPRALDQSSDMGVLPILLEATLWECTGEGDNGAK